MSRRVLLWLIAIAALLAIGAIVLLFPPLRLAPPTPLVMPFGDGKHWVLVRDLRYQIGKSSQSIVVPRGFVTDFASIPQALSVFGLTPQGQYGRAAVIHDYLYWSQSCTRDQSDRLLLIAMIESNVGRFDKRAVYQGVHRFGKFAWESNRKERAKGALRVVPPDLMEPSDPNLSWPQYQDVLVAKGYRDPSFAANPPYCAMGDTAVVPE